MQSQFEVAVDKPPAILVAALEEAPAALAVQVGLRVQGFVADRERRAQKELEWCPLVLVANNFAHPVYLAAYVHSIAQEAGGKEGNVVMVL